MNFLAAPIVPKLFWVVLPLLLYAAGLAVLAWRSRLPSRLALNVQSSLLLLTYLLATAGLGIFWVANQQLPVFDWHYVFGYATLLLVTVHLAFNLPVVLRWFKRAPSPARAGQPQPATGAWRKAALVPAALAVPALAFYLGTRVGADPMPMHGGRDSGSAVQDFEAVLRYHEFSSESRGEIFKRAPALEWGDPPPPFKTYPGLPQISLPQIATPHTASPQAATPPAPASGTSLSAALRAPAPRKEALQLSDLADMLYLSAGITSSRDGIKRAAPSSGNLFPSELYVVARQIAGLPAGVYHYDARHHRLHALGPLPDGFGAPQAEDADAAIILSSVFRRTGYKYRDRAYRYAVADAGHLLENLRIAGHRAGMRAHLLAQFDEAAAAMAIGVDGIEEGVLAIMALRRESAASAAGTAPGARFTPAAPAPNAKAIGVTGMVHQITSLRLARPPDAAPAAADIVALPAPLATTADAALTIRQRRSQRRFQTEPIPLATISSLLAEMAQREQLSDAIKINLVVNRAHGLAPGVYRYLPRQHALLRVRGGDLAQEARTAALEQDVIGDAAVVLVLSADRIRLLAEGVRGYRHGFLEAGMVGQRWLLGAVARGLAACPVGAFYDDDAASLIGVDPRREWVLHFAALGWPAKR